MKLTKAGLEDYDRDGVDIEVSRPAGAADLLSFWHSLLTEIDADYTFGDLVDLLAGVEDIDLLSPLLGCDVPAFLDDPTPVPTDSDHEAMDFVFVGNVADPQRYVPDPSRPDEPVQILDEDEAIEQDRVDAAIAELTGERAPLKVIDATGDDAVTGKPVFRRIMGASYGTTTAPFVITRAFSGWGLHRDDDGSGGPPRERHCAFALDFTPVAAIRALPLRYDPKIRFERRPAGAPAIVEYETEIGITFGELLHAIFWELGFFGSPEARNENLEVIRERREDIDRMRRDAE